MKVVNKKWWIAQIMIDAFVLTCVIVWLINDLGLG